MTGQENKKIKFLSYIYQAESSTFTVRPKINWSPRKRGVRKTEDVKTIEELRNHITEYRLTKRSLAIIFMGSMHNPLQIMAPYVHNIKLIYRDVCRMNTVWDQEVTKKIEEGILEALEYFFQMENIEL